MHLSVISSAFMLAQVAAGSFHRDAIDLPTGWLPEGIALGRDHTVYVGSFNGEHSNCSVYDGPVVGNLTCRSAFDGGQDHVYSI